MTDVLSKNDIARVFDPKMPDWFNEKEPRSYQPKLKYRTVWNHRAYHIAKPRIPWECSGRHSSPC